MRAADFRSELHDVLARVHASFAADDVALVRLAVRERRNPRGNTPTDVPESIRRAAEEIVQLLEAAARILRPRETQELDDLVAGREPAAAAAPGNAPVRLRRREGRSSAG